jgi:microcystin-dependent protein
MPGVKISGLIGPATLQKTDEFPIARGGTTLRTNASNIFDKLDDLDSRITTISANSIYVNDSPTIDLTFNSTTRRLSADLAQTLDLSTRTVILPPVIALPPGLVSPFAASAPPIGWLYCDGSTINNGLQSITYNGTTALYDLSKLYTVIGSTYGAPGKLPDLRGLFVRGYGVNQADDNTSTNRIRSSTFGNLQRDAFQGHKHYLHDPSHDHNKTEDPHTHGITDPGHHHQYRGGDEAKADSKFGDDSKSDDDGAGNTYDTFDSTTNITINPATTLNFDILHQFTGVRVQNPISDAEVFGQDPAGSVGASMGVAPRTDHETRPNNIALLYCIKF